MAMVQGDEKDEFTQERYRTCRSSLIAPLLPQLCQSVGPAITEIERGSWRLRFLLRNIKTRW